MRGWLLATVLLVGCGGPVLRNAPRANPNVVAASAAAIAGAATLADPDAAARRQEAKREGDVGKRPQEVNDRVPSNLLDQLDETERSDDDDEIAADKKPAPIPAAPAPKAKHGADWPDARKPAPAAPGPTPADGAAPVP
jgi:hypothetical protein